MKKTIFALVAVLAFSSAAFAGQSQPGKPAAACADTHVKLDCGATESVEETGPATHNGSTENKARGSASISIHGSCPARSEIRKQMGGRKS